MRLMLGIDTGGTFTDAAVLDEAGEAVVATAKVPTTHHDLVVGIEAVLKAVVAEIENGGQGFAVTDIGLVSVSTTLATNALVEGVGEPAALIVAGFGLDEIGLIDGQHDLVFTVDGGHDALGNPLAAIDEAAVAEVVVGCKDVISGFAVASQFSVRNPDHELTIRRVISELTGMPVTCSHELSARLNGPRRALTALLNARLIGMIARLEAAVEVAMTSVGIVAPLMMVRGDGSLVASGFVARRPIETVLSGPAASVIGARHLAGIGRGTEGASGRRPLDGLVVDIGGTTTDIAVLQAGAPSIAPDGAVVAGHRTMIEAVDLATHGIGGDSEVGIDPSAADGFFLGPARALPLSRLAVDHPDILDELGRQVRSAGLGPGRVAGPRRGRFLFAVGADRPIDVEDRERAVLVELADGPRPEGEIAATSLALRAVERLRRRGLLKVACFTPTDAALVLANSPEERADAEPGLMAALLGAELLAGRRDGLGRSIAPSVAAVASAVEARLISLSAEVVLEAALRADGLADERLGSNPILRAALDHHTGLVALTARLRTPIVAVGASAHVYYERVAAVVGTEVVVPIHAEVANAVGAVVGRVRLAGRLTITRPRAGSFRVHSVDQSTFTTLEGARDHARKLLDDEVRSLAIHAGATEVDVRFDWSERTAPVEGKTVLIEATMSAVATGRPRLGGPSA